MTSWTTNHWPSIWEWLTQVPGDVTVWTIGWPGGNRASVLELFPDYHGAQTETKTISDILLTHYSDGRPMIPKRPIQYWYYSELDKNDLSDTSPERIRQLWNEFQDLNAHGTTCVIDATDWDHCGTRWLSMMTTLIQTFPAQVLSKQCKLAIYLPHVSMVRELDENAGGRVQV